MLKKFENVFFKMKLKNLTLFSILWLFTGFSLGTGILMGPVRWIADLSLSKNVEDVFVRIFILLLIGISFFLASWFTRGVLRSRRKQTQMGIPVIGLLCVLGSLYLWLTPQMMGASLNTPAENVGHFTFGQFPTLQKIDSLKAQGYTAVISLLHPAVVPFEPRLLAEEKENCRKVGLQFIHLPMLPWVSENTAALDSAKILALKTNGKYYVHCYLGKDRVGVIRRAIRQTVGKSRVRNESAKISSRNIEEYGHFERGDITTLTDSIYLTPYPTDEEILAFIVSGDVRKVVCLLNPQNSHDSSWINTEQATLKKYGIPYELMPLPSSPFDPLKAVEITRRLWTFPRPLIIHGFLSRGIRWESIIQAFRSNLPPLPPRLFRRRMQNGAVQVIAPNIAAGPQPTMREFTTYLGIRGVKHFIYLGKPFATHARRDSVICQNAGLNWQSFDSGEEQLIRILSAEGPHYLYGPQLSKFTESLKEKFGPPIPTKVLFNPEILKKEPAPIKNQVAKKPSHPEPTNFIGRLLLFFRRALPDVSLIILLSPFFIIYTALAAGFSGWLRVNKKIRTPYTRKTFHLFIFTMASILQFTGGLKTVALFGSIVSLFVLYAVYRGDKFPFYEAMARPTDAPHRTLFIIIPLLTTAVGGLTANFFFGNFSYIGYLVGGWGDAVGEPVGARWGNHKYQVPSLAGVPATRSLEGSTAVVIVSTIAAFIGLTALHISFSVAILTAAACGVIGALVESFSNHGLDNFTIQVAAAGMAYLFLG